MSALKIVLTLLADATLGAAVYPIVVPEDVDLPFIVVSLIYEDQDRVVEGAQRTFEARVSTACHAASPAAVNKLGEAVKLALEDVMHRSFGDGGSPETIWAIATVWKAGSDISDYSDDRTTFRRVIDWTVRWERTDP